MNDERVIDLSIDASATPYEVWEAIATGAGISSWFVPSKVDERLDGRIEMDFGDLGADSALITEWDPPHRLAYRSGGSSGTEMTHRWTVELGEDHSTVRLVVSGFGPEDDGDFEGLSGGWPIFLANLRLHLSHFRGLTARAVTPTAMLTGGHDRAWAELCSALDVPVDLATAAHLATSGEGVPMLSGTVEETVFLPGQVSAYLLVMDAPGSGTAFIAAEGDGDEVACSVWLYLYDDDSDEIEDRWSPFMRERWPAHDAGTTRPDRPT